MKDQIYNKIEISKKTMKQEEQKLLKLKTLSSFVVEMVKICL